METHAEAGVEISNHECKHISFTSVCAPHTCVLKPMYLSYAVTKIHSRLLQSFNVHILMLWMWNVHTHANVKNWDFECIYKAARWFTGLTKALRVSRTLQEVPIKHKYCTDSNALECHHAKILEYSAYRRFQALWHGIATLWQNRVLWRKIKFCSIVIIVWAASSRFCHK